MTAAGPLMPTYAQPPVTFVRGEGSWLYDEGGKRYLDLLSGLAVTSLGHAHPEIAAAFEPGDHGTTYGGQPLASAAAAAVLEVMEREDAPARAERAGARFRAGLESLAAVAEVRGRGLMLGVELVDRDAKATNAALLERGVVANAVTPTALRLLPSLLINDEEIDMAIEVIGEVLA